MIASSEVDPKNGNLPIQESLSKHREDGIFELRTSLSDTIVRTLYFYQKGAKLILTHGFTKKTQKTPRKEIERAKELRERYISMACGRWIVHQGPTILRGAASMDFEKARTILIGIESTSLDDLKVDLYEAAVRYAGIRARWFLSSREERRSAESARTAAHDRFIDTCNILSRNMRARGEDKAWRSLLGEDRKEIGDFACHLTAILGVRAR